MENDIQRGSATLDVVGAQLKNVECRETLCRIEHVFEDQESSRRYFDAFVNSKELDPLFHSMSLLVPPVDASESGGIEVVSYMRRATPSAPAL
jgi:hypothetical protein